VATGGRATRLGRGASERERAEEQPILFQIQLLAFGLRRSRTLAEGLHLSILETQQQSNKEKRHMSKKAAEHHLKAAEHHEHAARHHKEAAKHHQAGSHEKAAHHAHTARAHHEHADEHAIEAAKAHAQEHGSK
jgi:hypothetical protein